MSSNKWRFPSSNYGEKKGISSGDTETFKKVPFQAFAREILQNSIDAKSSDEQPVRVEFSLFKIKTDNIPGKKELSDAIRRCKELWSYKDDYKAEYESMMKILSGKEIECLRVSDFNTTGLIGVESTKQENNKFLALAKGTGVSEKTGDMAGGSKGVGKNAAFLMSTLRTVFYSTRSNKDINNKSGIYKGSIGVAELVSGYVRDDKNAEKRDYTQGTGYYSMNDFNGSINTILDLDPNFKLRNSEFGTDVYILGFNNENGWEKEVINSLLDSFMAAIVRNILEVNVNGKEINKETIKEIVNDSSIITGKTNRSNIISQYRLLTDDKINIYDIDTEYGNCQLRILPYDKSEEELATHKCAMIRYPLMKIKDESLGSSFRVSAMCIIGEGLLGKKLRGIENTQHKDWEANRIKDINERKEIQTLISNIKQQIKDKVFECLKIGNIESLDPNGASDYLPDVGIMAGDSNFGIKGEQKPIENISVSKPKINKVHERNTNQINENGGGLEPNIGGIDDNVDGDVLHPSGENEYTNGERYPGNEWSGVKDGENIIFKRSKLSGVRYKVISTNKNEGRLKIIFVAPEENNACYLSINLLDDSNNPVSVDIEEMKCNGIDIQSENRKEYGPFRINNNEKIILNVKTNLTGYFASEVKVYASRK